jgi:hypothetical protein
MNFPAWIGDDAVDVALAYKTPSKKMLYILAAREYGRLLISAAYKWVRGATDTVPDPLSGEVLTPTDIVLLVDAFPAQWSDYPPVPSAPAESVAKNYQDTQWQPRMDEIHDAVRQARHAAENFDLTWVDWQGII